MLRLAFILPALLSIPTPAVAAAPTTSPDPKTLLVPESELARARDLVQQLGSEEFAAREEAEESLARMGRLARVALLEGANTDQSPEVRTRCQGLLPKATSLEMKARLAVFLADTEGKYDHDLPGWNQFRALVRNEWTLLGHTVWFNRSRNAVARAVFAELISAQANRHMMLAVGSGQSNLASLASARRQELYSQKYPRTFVVGGQISTTTARREPTLADIATLLFAESQSGSKFVPPRSAPMSILMNSSGFTNAAQASDERGEVYRAVASAWLDTRTDPLDMQYAMSVATSLNMPDQACRLAVRLFQAKGATVYYRGNAASTLARIGNREHVPLLEKAFTDNTVLTTIRKPVAGKPSNEWETFDVQIRDVALAVSLILTQQKPDDYGFVDQYKANGVNGVSYSYTRFYLPDAKRDEALAKWKEWRAKNP